MTQLRRIGLTAVPLKLEQTNNDNYIEGSSGGKIALTYLDAILEAMEWVNEE